ncbi:hypothetical protein BLS_004284 [Venturia inaequalis]|uniref:Uncharacterized protein n=1 Tax=Venturia inaequalis TaxID=5025 RepID=A0A8H3YSE2_VENIN|nr:hypothetical protein BLS_004284 [Venturia inaequalis]
MSEELKLHVPPPTTHHAKEDTGAHELEGSSSDSEHFTDASEGGKPSRSGDASPIPITRVERVDDEPAYGEVPGTTAYSLRTQDAVPDEIEVVPEGQRSRSASRVSLAEPDRPKSPAVPKIVAEKLEPETPSYGDVPGTAAYEMRKADAKPDEIVKSPASAHAPPNPFSDVDSIDDLSTLESGDIDNEATAEDDDEGFGDDFDDFEEGQEAEDADFGEFDDGFQDDVLSPAFEPSPAPPAPTQPMIPLLDTSTLSNDIASQQASCAPYLAALFPSYSYSDPESTEHAKPSPQIFLSDRSLSLYTQLIAPPPLAPPNWLRSRIRRLFLVSLGVPVDLDEILPASKQKKLILPSINLRPSDGRSPRGSTDSRSQTPSGGQVSKLKADGNDSSQSLDSSASTAAGKRKSRKLPSTANTPQAPVFDSSRATRLAQTTEVKLEGMSDAELRAHVKELETLLETARDVEGFWKGRVQEAGKEKEAFEGVIENLVTFARKNRKPGAKLEAHQQISTSAHSAKMSHSFPRNLPREILQDIILHSFEDTITEDVEYSKRFASLPQYGTTISLDTSDAEHWSRVLKLALPNNADDVDYVLGKIQQEVQERFSGWKYTESVAVLDDCTMCNQYAAALAEDRVLLFASEHHQTDCRLDLCVRCTPFLESNILQDKNNHRRLRREINSFRAPLKAGSGSGQAIQAGLNKLLPELMQSKWSTESRRMGIAVQMVMVMTACERTPESMVQVLNWRNKKFQEDPPQWSVVLKDNSNGAEFPDIFQYWAQYLERRYTLTLRLPRRFGVSFPARKPLVDEYTASIKYCEQLNSQQPAPTHC